MKRRDLLRLSGRALALGATGLFVQVTVPASSTLARRVFPEDGALEYLVVRHEQVVGRRAVRFSRDSGDFVARIDTEIMIGPAATPRYRYVQHCEEVWRDGWLHAIVSDTDDDGALWRVRSERQNGIFRGVANKLSFTVSGYPITSTFWHRDAPTQQALLDVTDARIKLIHGSLIGEESLSFTGRRMTAKHYTIRGEINGDLWYDTDCRLVRIAVGARDGSGLSFELQ